MIVIYEQEYDIISIIDIIEDDKFENYIHYYKQKILNNNNILKIVDENKTETSYNFKVKYNYKGTPEDWIGFDYVIFNNINNFQIK